ncbi:MAG: DNA primase [Candidatus Theseobacter exili]|nr:DNA primase [Candidatus Theseobacter exili]
MISQNSIDEVRLRTDIVEIISETVPLKNAGRNFKGLCPFHSEKTPSFVVSPDKQIFHCFGCGEGGNVFSFAMKSEGMSFIEAVRKFANRAGVKLPDETKEDRSEREDILDANQKAQDFFCEALNSTQGERARRYLAGRELGKNAIERFGVGFAPPGEKLLELRLKKEGLQTDVLEKAGLIVRGKGGEWYGKFRSRIMFPIHNLQGRIIGFGGRTLDDGGIPKYLNSPDTPVFRKGNVLYGLNFARRSLVEKGKAILCEGYLDVIRLNSVGIENSVAALGTSFTGRQADLLNRYVREVLVALDADPAGQNATLRALQIFIEKGVGVRVMVIPQGHDPDSYIRESGAEGFNKLIENAQSFLDFQLNLLVKRHGINSEAGRSTVIEEMEKTISKIGLQVERDLAVKKLQNVIGVSEKALRGDLVRGIKKDVKSTSHKNGEDKQSLSALRERWLLAALLRKGELVPKVKEILSEDIFKVEALKNVIHWLYSLEPEELKDISGSVGRNADSDLQKILADLLMEPSVRKGKEEQLIRDCVNGIRKTWMEEKKQSLLNELNEAEKQKEDTTVIQEKIFNLKNEIRTIQGALLSS